MLPLGFASVILLLCLSLPLIASTNSAWFARAWQTEDGLPEHTIVGLEQTADGYLWVATHQGLFRFDGVRFQEFAPAMRGGVAQILAMFRDRRGRMRRLNGAGSIAMVGKGRRRQVASFDTG